MVNVPLIQGNSIQEINTSIIAIKKAQKELETLNTLVDNKIKALNLVLSGGAGKFIQSISQTEGQVAVEVGELTDTIASGNTQPATSNGVADAISTEATARDTAIASALGNLVENYWSLVINTAINTSQYTTIQTHESRKFSDYDFIDFYVGLYENSFFYPRGYCRIPAVLFTNSSAVANRIYRVDIPLVGSNNENVSFRYKTDTGVDCRAFNTSTTFYAKVLGEKITH